VITAENQREDAQILHRLGAAENLGDACQIDAAQWADALRRMAQDPARLQAMGQASLSVLAGRDLALAELEGCLLDASS
jgi:UDP-N-acetylglucosamine:LPS N-acetylglucosamine transferase